jgi:hypothetical protein
MPASHLLVIAALICTAHATSLENGPGQSCLASNNKVDPHTYKFISDCDEKTFCSANGTCVPRQCRRDDFPLGYRRNDSLPPMCSHGYFCPDEGDACRPVMPVGSKCQINRDDQCSPPPNKNKSASDNDYRSLCLWSTCSYVRLGALSLHQGAYWGPY